MGAATSLPPLQAAPPGRLLRLARALEALLDNPGNARIASLVEAGIIFSRRQYRERGGETSCVYHLPALAPCGAGDTPLRGGDRCHDGDTPCPDDDTPCQPADTNRTLHRPDSHRPTERPVASLDVEGLARRFQRASAGRWRLDTVRPLVADAITRAGVEAVRRLADEVDGAGLLAWEIRTRLQGLSQVSHSTTSAPPRAVAAPHPTEDAAEVARRRDLRHVLSRLDDLYRDPGQADHLDTIIHQIATSPRPGGGVWAPADVHRAGYRVPLAASTAARQSQPRDSRGGAMIRPPGPHWCRPRAPPPRIRRPRRGATPRARPGPGAFPAAGFSAERRARRPALPPPGGA